MESIGNSLFVRQNRATLRDWLEAYANSAVHSAVDAIPEADLATQTDEQLVQEVAESISVQPLQVAFDRPEREVTEVPINTNDVFGRQVRLKGLRAVRKIPFIGNQALWHLLPSSYSFQLPSGQISDNHLVIGGIFTEGEADRAPAFIEEQIATITQYLERQRNDIALFNSSLPVRIATQLRQRRSRLSKAADLLKRI